MSEQHLGLINIRGLPCSITSWLSREKYEYAMDFVPGDDDIILTSYPKTGTTWMKYIILQIKSKGQLFPSIEDTAYKFLPTLELVGAATVQPLEKPGCYRTHMPYNFMQKNHKAKYIYIYRNPEDTLVSYYHFAQYLPNHEKEFNAFFNYFLTGNIFYGNYFKHVLSYFRHHNDRNLLMVSYERLHANPKCEILRIAKFMGKDYYETLSKNELLLCKIIENTSFSHMKNNISDFHLSPRPGICSDSVLEATKVNFFRKGIIGDGKNLLAPAQRRCLKEAAKKALKATSIFDEWYGENNILN